MRNLPASRSCRLPLPSDWQRRGCQDGRQCSHSEDTFQGVGLLIDCSTIARAWPWDFSLIPPSAFQDRPRRGLRPGQPLSFAVPYPEPHVQAALGGAARVVAPTGLLCLLSAIRLEHYCGNSKVIAKRRPQSGPLSGFSPSRLCASDPLATPRLPSPADCPHMGLAVKHAERHAGAPHLNRMKQTSLSISTCNGTVFLTFDGPLVGRRHTCVVSPNRHGNALFWERRLQESVCGDPWERDLSPILSAHLQPTRV
jgi:hypothetical protein